LLAIYRTKFDASDEVIKKMLDDETWIIGNQAQMFMLKAEVIPTQEPLRAAAFAKKMPKFMNTPKMLKEIIMEKEEEMKKADEVVETPVENKAEETKVEEPVVEEPKAEVVEETKAEEPKDAQAEACFAHTITLVNPTADEVEKVVEKCSLEVVSKAECDKRVSGM